jgi:hypothetical protein
MFMTLRSEPIVLGLALATVGLALPATALAAPSPQVVETATQSVFRVIARQCKVGVKSRPDQTGTGFLAELPGGRRFVTALHVVAGCGKLQVETSDALIDVNAIEHALASADLAILDLKTAPSAPGLKVASASPRPGARLECIGFGQTPTVNSKPVAVRKVGATTIAGLLKSNATVTALERLKIDLQAPIINLHGTLLKGDSGAPIIDDDGHVVGVANGHLMQGTIPFSWAFPASNFTALLASPPASRAGAASDVLAAEEIDTLSNSMPSRVGGITCGKGTFQLVAVQTLSRLLSSADPFSAGHIGTVLQYARVNNAPVSPGTEFDIYVDQESGADFAVPHDFQLAQDGRDCVGEDTDNELEIRISTDLAPSFNQTSLPAAAFAGRMIRGGETAVVNQGFITPPVSRWDSMMVQRYAHYATEGYITFAHKGNTLLEASVRSLIPHIARKRNAAWFPALVGLYATTFLQ